MKHLFICIFTATLLSGCATIINGPMQEIPISSSPVGADISVDGCYMGQTPITVAVTRKHSHIITVSKPGFHAQNAQLSPVISGAVFGNILVGGFIGWGVDAITGSQYRIIPSTLSVDLCPSECLGQNVNQ